MLYCLSARHSFFFQNMVQITVYSLNRHGKFISRCTEHFFQMFSVIVPFSSNRSWLYFIALIIKNGIFTSKTLQFYYEKSVKKMEFHRAAAHLHPPALPIRPVLLIEC